MFSFFRLFKPIKIFNREKLFANGNFGKFEWIKLKLSKEFANVFSPKINFPNIFKKLESLKFKLKILLEPPKMFEKLIVKITIFGQNRYSNKNWFENLEKCLINNIWLKIIRIWSQKPNSCSVTTIRNLVKPIPMQLKPNRYMEIVLI